MALVLKATPGASDSNTYCTLAEAETYFETRYHKSAWTAAIDANKNICLVWATRLLDEIIKWKGLEAVEESALRWPRWGVWDPDGNEIDSTDIPNWLKIATAEFAFHLRGSDRTIETNRDLTGFKSVQVDVIKLEMMPGSAANSAKPVLPPSVWSIVKFYGSIYGKSKTLVRA